MVGWFFFCIGVHSIWANVSGVDQQYTPEAYILQVQLALQSLCDTVVGRSYDKCDITGLMSEIGGSSEVYVFLEEQRPFKNIIMVQHMSEKKAMQGIAWSIWNIVSQNLMC